MDSKILCDGSAMTVRAEWASCARVSCSAVLLAGLACPSGAANDTTFFSGRELGERLLANVVKIQRANQHGFGLVVSARGGYVYIATAHHVVVPDSVAEPANSGHASIEVTFCTANESATNRHPATLVESFDRRGRDIALLQVRQPAGYQPQTRIFAPENESAVGQETWLLGQSQQCGVLPTSGAMAALPNAKGDLRIDFQGVLGGDSGGPAISGYGVLGLITDTSDLTFTAFSVWSLQALLSAQSRAWWQLETARNIPVSDPKAAQIDLTETLNLYLFGVRNLQKLLLQLRVPRELFHPFSTEYNTAVNRFRLAKERHDGALKIRWPEGVFGQWEVLRDQLWQVHQTFWLLNDGGSQAIFDMQIAPPAVQAAMRDLEPSLKQLEVGIKVFLKTLTQGASP